VADHPLRPATDHRLGRPLPHQLPNRTRAPPAAINLSPTSLPGVCGISRSFPRLSPTTGQVPTRYSPVRHSPGTEAPEAFDLHVLSMPPAFVLSQDQTLMFNPGGSPLYRQADPPIQPIHAAAKPRLPTPSRKTKPPGSVLRPTPRTPPRQQRQSIVQGPHNAQLRDPARTRDQPSSSPQTRAKSPRASVDETSPPPAHPFPTSLPCQSTIPDRGTRFASRQAAAQHHAITEAERPAVRVGANG
jgi:hypothetical protein